MIATAGRFASCLHGVEQGSAADASARHQPLLQPQQIRFPGVRENRNSKLKARRSTVNIGRLMIVQIFIVVALSGCTGCIWNGHDKEQPTNTDTTAPAVQTSTVEEQDEVKTNGPVTYLVVGMETSKRFGSCPGCAIDAQRMNNLLSNAFGYKGEMLVSSQATKAVVAAKLREGIANTPANGMFIFCYSGHGGQEYLGGKEPDGAERMDEYLCLYDTYMQDDEIWDIIKDRKGRVMLYFDACHSATMYRSVAADKIAVYEGEARALDAGGLVWSSGFEFRAEDFMHAQALEVGVPRGQGGMLCWSGCKELEYSYGGSRGGVMTSALVANWKKGMTYNDLWKAIVKDVQIEQPTQHPVQTNLGSGFSDSTEAFR